MEHSKIPKICKAHILNYNKFGQLILTKCCSKQRIGGLTCGFHDESGKKCLECEARIFVHDNVKLTHCPSCASSELPISIAYVQDTKLMYVKHDLKFVYFD